MGHASVFASAVLVFACGSRTKIPQQDALPPSHGGSATGGWSGTGGSSPGSGGADMPGSGGLATGGVSSTAGAVASGGAAPTGGVSSTAGAVASGGISAMGGAIADAALDASATDRWDASTLSPLQRFCQGESKVGRQDSVVETPLTAYREEMASCCAAMYGVLLHTRASMGSDYEITIMQVDFKVASGVYTVGNDWRPLHVLVAATDDASNTGRVASGTVSIVGSPTDSAGFRVGVCIETPAGDAGQPAMMFHVPSAFVAPAAWRNRLGIYELQDPKLPSSVLDSTPLDALVLEQYTLLDLGSIASIAQASGEVHTFGVLSIDEIINRRMESLALLLLPFVVVADGERIYLGNFVSPLSSNLGTGPMVDAGRMSAHRFQIEDPYQRPDPRWDPRILKVLEESGRLLP
jgi:hypothetical protein